MRAMMKHDRLLRAWWRVAMAWLAMMAVPMPANAQDLAWEPLSSPQFSHLTVAHGLPYPIVLGMAQDGDGFIWFGTPGGLARWDGYRMQVFRHDGDDPASLPGNVVPALATDERGALWVGLASGAVARRHAGGFVSYRNQDHSLGGLKALASDGVGGVWAGGPFGLAHLDPATGTWSHPAGIANVHAILRDRLGTLWVGTDDGLLRQRAGVAGFDRVAGSDGSAVTALCARREGGVWFGSTTGQIGSVGPGAADGAVPLGIGSGQRISGIVALASGSLWVAEFGGGLRTIEPATGLTRSIRHSDAASGSLADDAVSGLMLDRSGLVWATTTAGVDRTNPDNLGAVVVAAADAGSGGLPNKTVRSIAVRPDGKVWLGFRHKGLALFDPLSGQMIVAPPGPEGLPRSLVQAVAALPDGQVWAGLSRGLYRFDGAGSQATPFPPLAAANIRVLRQDGPWLWAGGNMGLARIDPASGEMQLYRHDPDRADSLSDNSVEAIHRDQSGRWWIGTQQGLNLFDPAAGTFRRIQHRPGDSRSLPDDVIHALGEDHQHRLWVATGTGVAVLEGEEAGMPRFRSLTRFQGLPHDTVTALVVDRMGTVWVGTGDGVAAIDPQTLAVRALGPADGVGIRTTWVGSAAAMPDGTLLFGGQGGLTVIRPDKPVTWTFRPPVVITAARIGQRAVTPPPPGEDLVVQPGERDLELEFSALDYSDPNRNHYAYRLVGLDDAWVSTDANRRHAAYGHLPPGRYQFEVRGSNRLGVWSDPPLRVGILVLPYWHETAWARLIAVALVLGLTAALFHGMVRGRTALLRRRQRELEAQVALRTAELQEAHAHALASAADAHRAKDQALAADQAKSRFLAVASHEIRTPLNGLLGMLQLLDPETLPDQQKEYLATAQKSGDSLASLIDSVLEYGRHEAGAEAVSQQDISPRALADETIDLFSPQAAAKRTQLDLAVEPQVPAMVRCDAVRLTRIVRNLMANAVKFAPGGIVELQVGWLAPEDAASPPRLRVLVSDTGIGIATEMQDAIFNDFVQADESVARRFGGTGLGLAVCRRAAALMGGALTVDSAPDTGSVFELTIPVIIPAAAADGATPSATSPGLSVLLVDDDPINQQVGVGLLRRQGHRVSVVGDGPAAVEALIRDPFDVVLMDLTLPGVDGIETCRRIRALPDADRAAVRIIAVSGGFSREARARLRAVRVTELVTKPLHRDVLRQVLAGEAVAGRPAVCEPQDEMLADPAFLVSQWEVLGTADLFHLARLFYRSSRAVIAEIERAAQRGDRTATSHLAHRLAGSAGTLGLRRLTAVCIDIEVTIERAETPPLEQLVSGLAGLRRSSLLALASVARQQVLAKGSAVTGAASGVARVAV
jgi:signal transduction histidine kinase/streptogramin lyase/HPt (histidine-containing phosphotransfer) domain-containing protein/ActR/RegA family two-component response regulator